MKWLQSPENQVKRDSDISWDSHGKKNAETAWSTLTFKQMLENLVSCLHGTGLLIPLSHCVIPSLAQFPLFQLCKHAVFARILMILLSCYRCHGDYSSSSGSHGSRRSQQVAGLFCHQHLDHVVPVNPSRPLSFMNVGTPAYPIIEPVPCPVPEYPPSLDWQFLTGPHYCWATLGPSSTGLYSVEDEVLHNFNGSESQYALFSEAVQGSFATVTP